MPSISLRPFDHFANCRRQALAAVGLGAVLLALGACTGTGRPQTAAPPPARATALSPIGLQRVLGANARQLGQLFGRPQAQVTEGLGQKLQFANPVCVLDAYLYPSQSGAEPIVTYLDARRPDGADIDRASCVSALSAR